MAVTGSGNWQKSLWPGVDGWFNEKYAKHDTKYSDYFYAKSSDKQFEQQIGMSLLGQAPVKAEGAGVSYDTTQQTFINQFDNKVHALGVIITKEAYMDNQYNLDALSERPEALAFSMAVTKETVGANVFNNAFDTAFNMGSNSEGTVALLSTAHLNGPFGANGSNIITAADITETTLEDMLIDVAEQVDPRGLKVDIQPVCLVLPPNLYYTAHRIMDSQLQNDTANNAVNVVGGMLPGGIKVNPYLTDTDAFFVVTNVSTEGKGLIVYDAWPLEFSQDNDFDTTNMKVKAMERYSFGWADWRGLHGSAGA